MLTRMMFNVDPFTRVSREMDRLFDTLLPTQGATARPGLVDHPAFPMTNIWEDDQHIYAEAELPGFRVEDLSINTASDTLTISGKREVTYPEGATPIRTERASGAFERTLTLPGEIDVERVEATMRDGVLLVTMPKREGARARRVEIKSVPGGHGEERKSLPRNS